MERRQLSWDSVGTRFNEAVSASEAIERCGANFEVGLQPVAALSPEIVTLINAGMPVDAEMLKSLIVDNKKATMRLDSQDTLGIVSENYGIVQNAHAFDFVDQLTTGQVGSEKPVIECAGSIFGGRKTFITARFPEPIRIDGKDDVVDMYCVFVTTHDGTGAVTCMMTPVRVWCNNMLNLAFNRCSGRLSLRHTRFVAERLDLENKDNAVRAYQALNLYNTYRAHFEGKLQELAQKHLSEKQVKDIVAQVVLPKESFDIFKQTGNIFDEGISTRARNLFYNMMDSIESGVGQTGTKSGTGLWLVNGVTTHFQNHTDWRGKDEKKFESLADGHAYKQLQGIYDLIEAV